MSSLASMYPSAVQPAAPDAAEAPIAPAATLASPEPESPAAAPSAPSAADSEPDDDDVAIDAAIAAAEESSDGGETAPAEPDMTIDARPDFFAESDAAGNKIPAASVIDYASVARLPDGVKPNEGYESALRAAVRVGLSQGEFAAFHSTWLNAAQDPIKTTETAAVAALQAEHGEQYEATLASAKAFIGKLEKTWPTVRGMLAQTGLGNSPAFINRCAARARQLGL